MTEAKTRHNSAWLHLCVSLASGLAVALIIGFTTEWKYAPLAGWDMNVLVFLGWLYLATRKATPRKTAALASAEDPGRTASSLLLLAASLMSLGAVGVLIAQAGSGNNSEKIISLLLAVVSVFFSWTIIHAVYTIKYARTYYANKSGIDFNDDSLPSYADFTYLAFTIGMTYQVSDTSLTSPELRSIALRQALLSYLFGVVIIASMINFIVSLGGK